MYRLFPLTWLLLCQFVALASFACADQLEVALVDLSSRINGSQTPMESMEKEYLDLTKLHETPEELGRIYAALADSYCQSGLRDPESVIKYAEKALEYPLEPLNRMETYSDLGSALKCLESEKSTSLKDEPPCPDITPYLKALRVAVEEKVPDEVPEIPRPRVIAGVFSKSDPIYQENEQRKVAWEAQGVMKKLMKMRGSLETTIFLSYLSSPCDSNDLRALAEQYLKDDHAVERFMKRYGIAKDENEGRPIEGPSVLYPNMSPELREKIRTKKPLK